MIKIYCVILMLTFSVGLYSQKNDDNRIVVTLTDTTHLYERTRQAIVNTNLIIREDSKRDSLITYTERIDKTTIFVIAKVVILENTIEIYGAFGLGYEDFWGFPGWQKGYKRIVYYKESEAWKVLRQIAIKLDGKMSYYKQN